jgi:hypothetical protein
MSGVLSPSRRTDTVARNKIKLSSLAWGLSREAVWQPSTVHLHTGAIWDCSAQRGRDVREVSVE